MSTFLVPPPLRGPTRGEGEIPVRGATVRACLEEVEARCPGFRELVLTPAGAPHRWVRFFVNGEPLAAASALERAVAENDEVSVLAAIAGG